MALMTASAGNFRLVFWVAVVPGLLAVAILVFGVREPRHRERPQDAQRASASSAVGLGDLRRLGPAFWGVLATGSVLTMARFSEAFLVLCAENAGLAIALVPLVLVIMNVVYAGSAYPVGALSDRVDRRTLMTAGFVVLIVADVVLALGSELSSVLVGVALWGLHMGVTQGLLAALIADAASPELRGSAFGVYHLATGIAALLASLIAGALWAAIGPAATFLGGALFTAVGLFGIVALTGQRSR
jgi:MFS family permease